MLDQMSQTVVCNSRAMPEMNVVKVLPQLCNGQHTSIGDVATFCENHVTKTRRGRDGFLKTRVIEFNAICQVQDA